MAAESPRQNPISLTTAVLTGRIGFDQELAKLFGWLAARDHLSGLTADEFAEAAAHSLSVSNGAQSTGILVVTPYNMQADLLRRRLPEGARVGTVDKLQGQEAAVVLISMATSGTFAR